ncbi:sarcosine oxidase subunit gamma family protein [Albimonas sp. CAU 1670]|uniref:sarcosine oxidase subunit gamma family protein n=1 Tax=Albimonas sp. CAU 1670 TaxID=3032599 RepID=UPI0023DA82EC|nr:sarcosine oxidase subunit gamma family protein [Albimonas sp. CAU 1670]MDF2234145.1 sarcosine oxidase subunit gamma family protein [Albimonas sp. CAU 1670]
MADALTLAPVPALAGAPSGRFGPAPAATLRALDDRPMTQLLAARGTDLDARLAPLVPASDLRVLGPGQRLALGLAPGAFAALAPAVIAVEQTGSRARIAVEGAGAAALLAKGVGADLHPSAFPTGASAPMLFGRISIVLTRTGAEAWEVLVPRSYALDLWEELIEAGRASGVEALGP